MNQILYTQDIDAVIRDSLAALASDPLIRTWKAKEHDWVSYFAFRYLLRHCTARGVISGPAQIGIEVGVPQPAAMGYKKPAVRRDIVIWPAAGMTCWDENWRPTCHPLAIVEWKVHRPGRRNRFVDHERRWLRSYCRLHPTVVAYAIEVDGTKQHATIRCCRYLGADDKSDWLKF